MLYDKQYYTTAAIYRMAASGKIALTETCELLKMRAGHKRRIAENLSAAWKQRLSNPKSHPGWEIPECLKKINGSNYR